MYIKAPSKMQAAHIGQVYHCAEGSSIVAYLDECIAQLKNELVEAHESSVQTIQGRVQSLIDLKSVFCSTDKYIY